MLLNEQSDRLPGPSVVVLLLVLPAARRILALFGYSRPVLVVPPDEVGTNCPGNRSGSAPPGTCQI